MAAPTNGTIKRLVSEKGFGFVAASDGSEYFFHQSACNGCKFDSLREGQAVTFEKGQGPKGPRAENVRLAYPVLPPEGGSHTTSMEGGPQTDRPFFLWRSHSTTIGM